MVHERLERVELVRLSPHERKLIAILFCSTLPERFVKAVERVERFHERERTVVSREARAPERELRVQESTPIAEVLLTTCPERVPIDV
jgi:hypothetical protein